ncbi:GNAT family N-acetyltransferase [Waterburya agarophytonicola K14]|uniref:GNAT family N-acetyltransferase n=1 Tax=Waterburya agarophytonicola KI4 TaxID=2874699 RepID=A0A964BQG4_9CYAN|nr:GNAT family N-acetyltransferase [Waterburya agarophytonicola]MCC0176462.1 GNAT family N-acetyltransferase [Waterburya agarophytonicola KI4]
MGTVKYSPPQRISTKHIVENFDCGEISLNDWLIKRALKNDLGDASRTYVVCCDNTVVAYYSLHLGCIQHSVAVRKIKPNMPDPIPAIVLGRLAVDELHQGKGLARALIKDMFLRAIQVSDLAGTKAVVVKALNDKVTAFYQSFGFVQSKTDLLLLMKAIAEVRASLNQ